MFCSIAGVALSPSKSYQKTVALEGGGGGGKKKKNKKKHAPTSARDSNLQ